MGGVDGTKWHLLRSCPLAPSCQGQGSQFAFTGGQRPWWSLVSSGLSVAASFASLPRRLAQSLNLRALSIGPAGIRGGRGVGTRTTLGPWSRLSCGPGLGGGRGEGVWAWEKLKRERQRQVASTLLWTRYMVPCTMQAVHGDARLLWARMWVMWVLRWDHHPFAIPALRAATRTLLLALIQCLPPQLRRGQHEASDGSTLSWPLSLMCTWRPKYMSLVSPLNIATACGMPAGNRVATRQTSDLSLLVLLLLLQGTRRN